MPFIKGVVTNPHGRPPTPEPIRFSKYVECTESCWWWKGNRYRDGYGRFRVKQGSHLAHRWAKAHAIGRPLESSEHVHHLCGNKACVRPDHLEIVTPLQNTREWMKTITTCPHGHPYDYDNTGYKWVWKRGKRYLGRRCRACARQYTQQYNASQHSSSSHPR